MFYLSALCFLLLLLLLFFSNAIFTNYFVVVVHGYFISVDAFSKIDLITIKLTQ